MQRDEGNSEFDHKDCQSQAIHSRVLLGRFAVSTQWEQQVQNGESIGDIHRFFCCCARRLGHMHMILSGGDGTPLVIAGPCWPFCTFVTVPLIVGISGLVCYFFIINDYFSLVRCG